MDITKLVELSNKELVMRFQKAHEEVFQEINCLECANCCKTTGPIVEQEDFEPIAKYLKISTSEFLQEYLEMDEDGDFVMQSLPCPFLLADNKCKIYEVRPEACRDFPHTNRTDIKEYLDLIEPNKEICPAVPEILNKL